MFKKKYMQYRFAVNFGTLSTYNEMGSGVSILGVEVGQQKREDHASATVTRQADGIAKPLQ